MLTARQNYYEAVTGGNPDRFANQYEAIRLCMDPHYFHSPAPALGQFDVINAWGVYNSWPENSPGAFPVHTPDKIVIKDIEDWKEYVKAPSLDFPDEEWEMCKKVYDSVDTNLAYKAAFIAPGLFEQCHHLGEIQNTLMNLYEYPDEMHDLIKYLTDYELGLAELICKNLKPDALFHHDDFGSRTSTFMKPDMWEEFFVPAYKELYGYYKNHGCELIIHHSDSYGATIVPLMIEMGMDVWQGCMTSNNLPELTRQWKGKIGFMGGFDGADYDLPDWDVETTRQKVFDFLDQNDKSCIVPCIAQGGPGSVYDDVYETILAAIDDYNIEHFNISREETTLRGPMQLHKNGYM